jgi:lipopolysaccharide exporter
MTVKTARIPAVRKTIKALLRPGNNALFARAMSAGFWASALRVLMRLLLILRTIILARLLAPHDFGLMAIATISILFVERFTESGINSALVQRRDDIGKYLNTAWTMQIVRGAIMAGFLALAAPYIAAFFDAPESGTIIRVLAIGVFLKGFTNIAVVFFVKELRFDRFFVLELSGKGVDFVVSLAYAVVYRNVWALVFGLLAGAVTRLAVSYTIDSYRPRIQWVWSYVKRLFSFGKWILVSNILGYATGNIDDVMVGRVLGIEALGFYRMAYNFSQSVATEVTQVTNQVAFPTYSKLQESASRLRSAYMGSLHLVSFVGFPLAIGTILVASDFTIGVLGDKWASIVVPLQLLSIAGLMRGLGATIGPLFQSQGRPDVPPRFSLAKLALYSILLYPAIETFGIEGAAAVVALSGTITGIAALVAGLRLVEAPARDIVQAIGFPALNTTAMIPVVLGVSGLLPSDALLSFFVLTLTGVVVYVAAVLFSTQFLGYSAPSSLIDRIRGAIA